MRILKYILLLLLLFSVAFAVFVATQPGDYKIVRSKEITISKDILFNFVADTTALSDWSPWGQNEARYNKYNLISNDTISQEIIVNDKINTSLFQFEKTKKGTLVTWTMQGKMGFKEKIFNTLQGGVHNVIGNKLVDGLKNIDDYLIKELATYSIKIEGLVTKHATNYIQQIDTCNVADFQKTSKAMLQNMLSFVEKNEIKINGLPFIVYENRNTANNQTIFAMCVPVEEEILTTEGSEISGGHFDEFLAVKTTLVGDYSHNKEAWQKTNAYIKSKKLVKDETGKQIEIYKVSLPKERKPSKWVTEIYIPVKKKIYRPKVIKTETVEPITIPADNPTKSPVE